MAKPKAKVLVTSDGQALTASPFVSLAALKDQVPEGKAPAPSPTRATTEPTLASVAKLVVRKERKGHGGKTVTLVQGLPNSLRDAVADKMKRALGCGARVDGEAVVLQGELVERACEWLAKNGAKRIVEG